MTKAMIVLTLAALLLTSCTQRTFREGPNAPPPDSPVSTTVPPGGLDGLIGSPAAPSPSPVVPSSGLENERAVRWQGAEIGKDGRSLTLTWWTGAPACVGLDHVDVAYGSKTVTVTLYEGTVPGSDACIEIAVFASTTVGLDQAVDGRTVMDGAVRI
jgi:hypothetical protein